MGCICSRGKPRIIINKTTPEKTREPEVMINPYFLHLNQSKVPLLMNPSNNNLYNKRIKMYRNNQ